VRTIAVNYLYCCLAGILCLFCCFACDNFPGTQQDAACTETAESDTVTLAFAIVFNQEVYESTDYGEPPQCAVWLEDTQGRCIVPVWVTYRVGSGKWKGKVTCPTALPYWVSRYHKHTAVTAEQFPADPVIDAVTSATPKQGITVEVQVPRGSRWHYFIEVNASGDYNETFSSVLPGGAPDLAGNGQPSLVYRGDIKAIPGHKTSPKLIGRTHQAHSVDDIIEDLDGITSAKSLLSRITVSCR